MDVALLLNESGWMTWTAAGIMLLTFIIQSIYYIFIFSRFTSSSIPETSSETPPVSVILCARNEADNLQQHLGDFLTQDYPDYEVIVVNDCSTDHTDDVLMEFKVRYPHLKVTTINQDRKFSHGKKLAVTVGIKAAGHEHLLFSDADCRPAGPSWISQMARHFNERTEIVLGIGKYERKGGLLNLLVRYETLFTAMQYVSFALLGHPFMGVGRNLAYKKQLFFRNKGFASHLKLQSGDDDLFVKETANRDNTALETGPGSFTLSIPPTDLKSWIKQKRRHITTGKYYSGSTKLRLGTEYISRILFYASVIFLLTLDHWFWVGLGAYILLSAIKLIRLKRVMKRLNERDLLLPSLVLEPLLPLALGTMRLMNKLRSREHKWS